MGLFDFLTKRGKTQQKPQQRPVQNNPKQFPVKPSQTPQQQNLVQIGNQFKSGKINLAQFQQAVRGTTLGNQLYRADKAVPTKGIMKPLTNKYVAGASLGAARSAAGTAEDVSGLVDLASPGRGTSRVTKQFKKAGETTDKVVKREGYSKVAYKGGQVAGEIATFLAPGTIVAKGATTPTKVVTATNKLSKSGKVGKTAAGTVRALTNPSNVINTVTGTAQSAGHRSARSEDVNIKNVGVDLALNTGAGLGLEAAGSAKNAAIDATKKRIQQGRADVLNKGTTKIKAKELPIDKLTSYEGAPSKVRVSHYKNEIENNRPTDPIIVVKQKDGTLSIEDGKHRYEAHLQLGKKTIAAKVISEQQAKDLYKHYRQQGGFIGDGGESPIVNGVAKLAGAGKKPTKGTTTPPVRRGASATPVVGNTGGKGMVASSGEIVPLPKKGVRTVSTLDKVFRSTRSIIERQGEHGQKLGGLLRKSRDTEEMFQGELEGLTPTVRKLRKEHFENMVDVVEGRAKPINQDVAKAADEWKAAAATVRERAVKAGVDMGNLGDTYFPHFVDYEKLFKDESAYNKAVNHLIRTGQAKTQEEAIQALARGRNIARNRRFGNLEASRELDLPDYDKSKNAIARYFQGASKRIAHVENFGQEDEQALKLIAKAAGQGHDAKAMKDAFDVAVQARRYSDTGTKASDNIRKYITLTKLGKGAVTNLAQNVNTGIVTGHIRTLGSMVKSLNKDNKKFVQETGVVADAVLNDIRDQAGFAGKVMKITTAPGFSKVEKMNRSVAAIAGRDYARSLAKKGKTEALRKLGVKGEIGKKLTPQQEIDAARSVVEKTQFKVDPQDLPGWADHPAGKLVAQFRTFSYNQSKFFSNEILKPAAKGDFMPLGRLLAALPVGYALTEGKRILNSRPEDDDTSTKATIRKQLEVFGNIGGAGLALDIPKGLYPLNASKLTKDRAASMAVGTIGGPAVSTAAQGVAAVATAAQGDLDGAKRFGLQQVPIIGSNLTNILMPYGGKDGKGKNVAEKPGDIALAGFSKDEQKFLKMDGAAQKAEINKNPDLKRVLDSYNASKKGLTPRSDITAKLPQGMSPASVEVLVKNGRLTDQGRDAADASDPHFKSQLAIAHFEKDKLEGKMNGVDEEYRRTKDIIKDVLGDGIPSSQREAYFDSPAGKFKLAEARYKVDKQYDKIDDVEDLKRRASLARLQVQSKFDKDTVDIYSLSKPQLAQYIQTHPIGREGYEKLNQLDAALVQAGVIARAKFRTGFTSGTGSGSGSKRRKSVKVRVASALIRKIKISTSTPRIKKVKLAKVSAPKVRRSKSISFKA